MVEPRIGLIDSAYLWLRRGQAARVMSRAGFLHALSNRETTLGPRLAHDASHGEPVRGELALLIAAATRS